MSYTPGPLPEPGGAIDLDCGPAPGGGREVLAVDGFTAHQMREYAAAEVARAVAAERERCAKVCEPKGKRPCDCTACDCGNSTDERMVAEWDEAMSLAAAIRADPQRLHGKGE